MSKKKVTIKEFNKDFFNSWTKIKKIVPHFVEWTSLDDDEGYINSSDEIERIDIEFDNGEKISILPESNQPDLEEDVERPLCLCLKIRQYKGEEVNWKVPKE